MIPPPARTRVLGFPVSRTDLDGAVSWCSEVVAARAHARVVVTNHNKCWLACRDPALRGLMEEAELVVAESSVVWAARRLGRTGVGAAWGVRLMDRLLKLGSERGWSAWFLGARPHVLERLVERAGGLWPGVEVVGARDGYFDPSERDEVVRAVVAAAPDLLFVALGSPRQEHFMAALPSDAGPGITIGVGGSFDVHAGFKAEAPRWIRGSGAEWLYRSALDPRLLRRYGVVVPWFVAAVARERATGAVPACRG